MTDTKLKSVNDFIEAESDLKDSVKKSPAKKKSEDTTKPKMDKSNELKVIKAKIESIVYSKDRIDEEKEAIKEICNDLKNDHLIKPAVAKKVADILRDPEKIGQMQTDLSDIQALFDSLKP
jgi:vacuolar-type H+-ATPase subunit I/STV1